MRVAPKIELTESEREELLSLVALWLDEREADDASAHRAVVG